MVRFRDEKKNKRNMNHVIRRGNVRGKNPRKWIYWLGLSGMPKKRMIKVKYTDIVRTKIMNGTYDKLMKDKICSDLEDLHQYIRRRYNQPKIKINLDPMNMKNLIAAEMVSMMTVIQARTTKVILK